MRTDLNTLAWTSAGQVTEALSRECRLPDIETEAVRLTGGRVMEQLRYAVPCVVEFPGEANRFLGIAEFRRGRARLLDPGLKVRSVPVQQLRDALCRAAEAPLEAEIDRMLDGLPGSGRARAALLAERLGDRPIATAWQLRTRPGSSFARQLRESGITRRLTILGLTHVAEYALWLLAWWMIGSAALSGRIDPGWLAAWLLTLATIVPLRIFGNWTQSVAGIGLGGLLKQRILAGALALPTEEIRRQGAGQLFGRAIESETVETLAVNGGLNAALSILELLLAWIVLALGAGGAIHSLLLLGWVLLSAWLVWRFTRARSAWTDRRLEMTHDLVERMSGHRTRLAQSPAERWHDGEDRALDGYLAASGSMDRARALLTALVPRGWLIVGICGLVPPFVSARLAAVPGLAAGLGGVILAHQALQGLLAGATQLTDAAIAWRRVGAFFRAASTVEDIGATVAAACEVRTVVEAHDLTFRYPGRAEPALRGASLQIKKGDWLLLEGPSGGGKSTLAAVLAGLRRPDSGLLLSGGLDRPTLGEAGWRQRVAAAPQYHENHILTGPLAFNLLMGRNWPPTPADLSEAETVCRELGLGSLLERMPAGILQTVGDTGWQLSQGERSRVFLARALLQSPKLVLLDESFAALDPENLRQSLECVLRRAETLMVVAHP
ncbi:MAG TPA: ABC transporter ATP-binding protein [Bryobacteraceae bacterium]|nr:ABC transporter ATP-binding protein [Bryobacteraceae bacterium]